MSNLFQHGAFRSAAGLQLTWKIDCDALTDMDWRTVAGIVTGSGIYYREAVGVPTGGERFAAALNLFCWPEKSDVTLLVDDVLTTGGSMIREREKLGDKRVLGIVLFSRMHNTPEWIRPIFQLGGNFYDH